MSNPISFSNNWKKDAVYFMGDGNNTSEIVITKKDKAYVRGEQLYFKYKDTHIYADLDSIIYINTKTDIIQIKKYKELTPADQREYLVLLSYYDEEISNTYQGFIGRQTVFDYLKSVAEEIDLEQSLILAETVEFRNAINVYDFLKECILNGTVENEDGFDVEEYVVKMVEYDEE